MIALNTSQCISLHHLKVILQAFGLQQATLNREDEESKVFGALRTLYRKILTYC